MCPNRVRVLVVDDEPCVCESVCAALAQEGFDCQAVADPRQARRLLETHRPAVLVADISMPEASGLDLLEQAQRLQPACRVILITGASSTRRLAEALSLGAYDYLEKPLDLSQLVETVKAAALNDAGSHRLSTRAAEAIDLEGRLRQASVESMRALARAVEAKDAYTRRHSDHVAFYAANLAEQAGVGEQLCGGIRTAAMLHDIGMIGVPDKVLSKVGPLSDEEQEHIRRHPALGAQILDEAGVFASEAHLVRHHHERWDGHGYPEGLAGEEIPLGARILLIADSIDAMLMPRTYRSALPVDGMLEQLIVCAGRQFDPRLAVKAVRWCRTHADELVAPGTKGRPEAMPQPPDPAN
ncbi:MAG TPA: HD domain-containing phosphohydrolase [Phycisphaerae bacterium]|nr:HD domain-containing phosphohydrolase [Phycisphaerae bacterium]